LNGSTIFQLPNLFLELPYSLLWCQNPLLNPFQVREVRVLSLNDFWPIFESVWCCMSYMLLWICEVLCIVVWVRRCGCCRENSGKVSYSRPSDADSLKRDLQKQTRVTFELSLMRRALVLSEAPSRSGERCSLKRERVGVLVCCCCPSPGEEPHLWARVGLSHKPLGEYAKNLPWPLSRSRLSESLQLEREHSSRLSEGFWLERDPLQATLFSLLGCYGLFDWLICSI